MNPDNSPPPLQPGDSIGIVAPAGPVRDRTNLERGISILKEMGFAVKYPRNFWPGTGYLADTDSNRAREFHKMWEDPDIAAILALRGGFGSLRLLPFLDPAEIQKRSKLLIGFSDITVLHNALFNTTGAISFHGPMLTSLSTISQNSRAHFFACLAGRWNKPIQERQVEVLRGGDPVKGRLIGGNLSSLISIIGTPIDQNWSDCLVFLEDVGEPLYRIDRMLTQLWHSGKLNHAAAIILGDFSLSKEQNSIEKIRFHEEIWKRVLELTAVSGQVVWGNFPIGHGVDNLTLPHGADATMDSGNAILSFP